MTESLPAPLAHINLIRPLATLDLETTGLSTSSDRIVEISIRKDYPNGEREYLNYRINPEMAISSKATERHGLANADVEDQPTFSEIADEVISFLKGCDLHGFNIKKFDLPLLKMEFVRVGKVFCMLNRTILDSMQIFHKKNPRGLADAHLQYCGRPYENGHSALGDVQATVAVLDAMVDEHDDLPDTVLELSVIGCEGEVDLVGKFVRDENGMVCFNFGQHKGKALVDEHGYAMWMLGKDFEEDTKEVIRKAFREVGTR